VGDKVPRVIERVFQRSEYGGTYELTVWECSVCGAQHLYRGMMVEHVFSGCNNPPKCAQCAVAFHGPMNQKYHEEKCRVAAFEERERESGATSAAPPAPSAER